MSSHSFRFDPELVWPWSYKPWGPWSLAGVVLLLVTLTVWTYAGARGTSVRRILMILGLRLAALVLACLMIVRPSLAVREMTYLPARLLILYDRSQSMSIRDEYDSKSRWEAMQHYFKGEFKGRFDALEKQNVTITEYQFDADLRPYDSEAQPLGPRTAVGQSLNSLYKLHVADKNLLGLVVVSDGADNGTTYPALAEAEKWKKLPCKVYTVGLGKPTTSDRQQDIALTSISVEPSPVPVKGKMTVRATIDAPGFENATIKLHLKIDGKEVLAQPETLKNKASNEVVLVADAPTKPGEVLVTLESELLPKEATDLNNRISTYATISKEGISVLLVDRLRLEQKFIRHALESDPRFRVFVSWRVTDQAPAGIDLFQFDQRQYDVIIVGDLSSQLFTAGDPTIQDQVYRLVTEKGVGLLMMGGRDSFGNSDWNGTPMHQMLPVTADVRGQVERAVRMEPTTKGLEKILMRLEERPAENKALWNRLPEFTGITPLGTLKATATPFAVRSGTDEPVLAYGMAGDGRVMAFAGDETWRWLRLKKPKPTEGVDVHARFWRQMVLFLAKQDDVGGSAWIKPETRRLAAGSKLRFDVGLHGKGGLNLKDGRFEVKVHTPLSVEVPIETVRDQDGDRGIFWQTDTAGEYRIQVTGRGKDVDGKDVTGTATARFIVYQDEAEMARRSADHDFLDKLARAGGGKFFAARNLNDFFKEIDQQSLRTAVKTERWPDWEKEGSLSPGRLEISWFLLATFLAFTALLCSEWLLRRRWGLV